MPSTNLSLGNRKEVLFDIDIFVISLTKRHNRISMPPHQLDQNVRVKTANIIRKTFRIRVMGVKLMNKDLIKSAGVSACERAKR